VRRRLYVHLYVALLASALVCLVVAAIAFRLLRDSGGPPAERLRRAAELVSERLPDARAADARARLVPIADEFAVEIIAGDDGGPRVGVPSPRAFPFPHRPALGRRRERFGPVLAIPLDGDGWAALRPRGPFRQLRLHPFFATLVVLALVMAVGSYPVARRVTRRLETLTRAVEQWGGGDLGHRVPVSGDDEIGALGATFNQAAERLDLLVGQQRQMLANASHELRSPLARLRMGLELIAEEPDATRRQGMVREIHRDIVDLDGLIEDVLLFARTDVRVPTRALVSIDLRTLVEEEAGRTGAVVDVGASPTMAGDVVLLRHLVRNLLENAQRHGGGNAAHALIAVDDLAIHLTVEDQGPGVPDEDRERIFAPFYRRASGTGSVESPGQSPAPGAVQSTGHGLGLALVRQVARYHGGEVAYQSRPGGGSRFTVTLPIKVPEPGGSKE
jgi:signal transduction histidine kinase